MEDYAERIVEKALELGAQDAVGTVYEKRNYQIRFSQSQIDITNQWREAAGAAFVAVDRRIGVTEIKDLAQIDKAVEQIVKVARASQENPQYGGLAKGPFRYRPLSVDRRILDLTEGADFVQAAINGAAAEGAKETAGSFWRRDETLFQYTSNGARGQDRSASLYLSIRGHTTPDASGHGVACAVRYKDFDPEQAGRKAGRIGTLAKNPKPGKAGTYDVVMDPMFTAAMIDPLASLNSAFYVLGGLSPTAGKVGQRIASPAVTVADDATAPTITGRRFDEEGVPTKRTVFLKGGVLTTHLHNTSTAKLFKTRTTANAGLVVPTPQALVFQGGKWTRDEVFRECKDGLWITNTWYTRFQNYLAGEFSTIPRDGIFRIRKGEVVGAVKSIRVSDNLLHLWKSVKGLSKETRQVKWWGEVPHATLAPYALVKGLRVTKSAM